MYNVFIVDDETIILSGIKFLIDWEKNDCVIMNTARNGRDALEKIRAFQPDIILCDIKMPIMDGVQLLEIVHREFPSIVFIMLTNLQEFHLVREAIHNRALDYLLKNQLDAPLLEEALAKAKKEHDQRRRLMQDDKFQYYDKIRQKELVQKACLEILFSADASSLSHAQFILAQNKMLDGYSVLYIPLDFSPLPNFQTLTNDSRTSLTAWEKELAARLCSSLFGENYLFIDTGQNDSLTVFLWGQGKNWEKKCALFSSKFSSASENITQVRPCVCSTPCFFGAGQIDQLRQSYFQAIEYFYLNGDTDFVGLSESLPSFEPLGLSGIGSQLEAELNSRNLTGCMLLLDKAIDRLKNTVHQKSQAAWLCNELYRSVSKALSSENLDTNTNAEIRMLITRSQVIRWIENLKNTIAAFLGFRASSKSAPVEKARQYVIDHVEEHISLQEAAEAVCISPSYLSTLFKQQYNQSFVSFINQTKVERACALIAEKNLLSREIAYQLGFENAYYFSKVFRRYTGMTPSEYKKSLKDNEQETAPSD